MYDQLMVAELRVSAGDSLVLAQIGCTYKQLLLYIHSTQHKRKTKSPRWPSSLRHWFCAGTGRCQRGSDYSWVLSVQDSCTNMFCSSLRKRPVWASLPSTLLSLQNPQWKGRPLLQSNWTLLTSIRIEVRKPWSTNPSTTSPRKRPNRPLQHHSTVSSWYATSHECNCTRRAAVSQDWWKKCWCHLSTSTREFTRNQRYNSFHGAADGVGLHQRSKKYMLNILVSKS